MDATTKALLVTVDARGKQGFRRGAIVYTYGGSIADYGIRVAQGFRGPSHVGIACGDGKMVASFLPAGGVTLQDDLQPALPSTEARFPWKDDGEADAAVRRALGYVGKVRYDLGAIAHMASFGFVPAFAPGPPAAATCSAFLHVFVGVRSSSSAAPRFTKPLDLWP